MNESFIDSLISKLDNLDPNNMQAFILKLFKQKGFLETIFNAIKEGVVVIDRKLKIRYANKSAADMLGLPEKSKELNISAFLRDIDWKRILQEDENEWYRISKQDVKVFYPTPRILSFYIVPHEQDNDLATIIMSDISDSKRSYEETKESEKVQMMSILAAGVAHEIGNPLNSLNIHLQLLSRELNDINDKNQEVLELLDVAKSEVKRLDLIITQFLTAIRPTKPIMAKVDLNELIKYVLNFMKNELLDHNVIVNISLENKLPEISGDANQLKQALFNLIKNSIQAMTTGGNLNISTVLNVEKDNIKLTIKDTGSGISSEKITHIFEPYFTDKNNGTGLGLMIVDRIIREHGGELAVESEPGKGTSFILNFPLLTHRIKLLSSSNYE